MIPLSFQRGEISFPLLFIQPSLRAVCDSCWPTHRWCWFVWIFAWCPWFLSYPWWSPHFSWTPGSTYHRFWCASGSSRTPSATYPLFSWNHRQTLTYSSLQLRNRRGFLSCTRKFSFSLAFSPSSPCWGGWFPWGIWGNSPYPWRGGGSCHKGWWRCSRGHLSGGEVAPSSLLPYRSTPKNGSDSFDLRCLRQNFFSRIVSAITGGNFPLRNWRRCSLNYPSHLNLYL